MSPQEFKTHLADVVADQTRICAKNEAGPCYRGYALGDLAAETRFEEVAHLLIYEELPSRQQLSQLHDTLMEYRRLALPVRDTMRSIPTDIPMMDVLRTTVSLAGHFDPTAGDDADALRRRSIWLLATVASLIAARYRMAHRETPIDPQPGLGHAAQLLHQCLGREAEPSAVQLVDKLLVLYAEHGFSPSTFAARVIASTRTDLVSAVVGAIGALKGPRHGGAAGKVADMMSRFESVHDAESAVTRMLEQAEPVPGFGSRVYTDRDPRVGILERELRNTLNANGVAERFAIYDAVRDVVWRERQERPNIDYPAGMTCCLLDLPPNICTPLFVASRIVGWCAHYIEQQASPGAYRPIGAYVGEPPRPIPPMAHR